MPIPFNSQLVLVGGQWRAGSSGQTLPLHNPSDGSLLAQIARGDAADIDAAVAAAQAALDGAWGQLSAAERGRILLKMSTLTLTRANQLANLEAQDVGKPLKQGRTDAVALARNLEFYGGAADKMHGDTIPFANGYTALTLRRPHGVTGHIAQEAGLPAGALNIVPGLGEEAGAALASHPGLAHLSFTGSVAVGRMIQAAAAINTIPVTLELGGKARKSCLPMPTWTRPCPPWSMPASRTVARPARRPSASWLSGPTSTRCGAGQVFINNDGAGGGIEPPFGGVKHSGHGREKGFEALYGFSSLKTVAIKHD